ncbi:MAG: ABC transporter ATP-binding protein [Isosphaeraceae bacterium]|jgi:ABC-2 type transport system ATP-binding protein|nr:MAG: ABC transporter ATP-binding protein [Isosphaeraceae bacterium]
MNDQRPEPNAIIRFEGASKWYGNVIGLNKLDLSIPSGITGLLGPNGAGKSTFLQLATGQLRPSQGRVTVLGQTAWNNPALGRQIGLCPEQDAFYEWMTGRQFVAFCAQLSGMNPRAARSAAEAVLDRVGLAASMNRPIKGYSKGMRQRTKLAQALVHDPQVLFLDEPLTGTDPVVRHELIQIIRQAAADGRTIVLSSHVLYEVEAITSHVVLINHGRLVAEGDTREIRDLIDTHPHRIVLKSTTLRSLATRLVAFPDVLGIQLRQNDGSILVETHQPDAFYERLPSLCLDEGLTIDELYSDDDSLEAVFKYLVAS